MTNEILSPDTVAAYREVANVPVDNRLRPMVVELADSHEALRAQAILNRDDAANISQKQYNLIDALNAQVTDLRKKAAEAKRGMAGQIALAEAAEEKSARETEARREMDVVLKRTVEAMRALPDDGKTYAFYPNEIPDEARELRSRLIAAEAKVRAYETALATTVPTSGEDVSVCSVPGNAFDVILADRDEWKRRAMAADAAAEEVARRACGAEIVSESYRSLAVRSSEELTAMTARAELAERSRDELATLVGQAICMFTLAPGENLAEPIDHALIGGIEKLLSRAHGVLR